MRDAIGRILASLPDGADEPRVIKNDSDADPVMRLAVTSDRQSPEEITDFVERNLVDRLSTLDGVASVTIRGDRRYAIRIWIDRRALAAHNLTVGDIEAAIKRNNVELPAGEITSSQRMLDIRLDSRLATVEDFRNVVLDTVDGHPVRLGDVAQVERGVADDEVIVRANGAAALGLQVLRQSQTNTMAISKAVRAEVRALEPTLPASMKIIVGSDDALFVASSIREVLIALGNSEGAGGRARRRQPLRPGPLHTPVRTMCSRPGSKTCPSGPGVRQPALAPQVRGAPCPCSTSSRTRSRTALEMGRLPRGRARPFSTNALSSRFGSSAGPVAYTPSACSCRPSFQHGAHWAWRRSRSSDAPGASLDSLAAAVRANDNRAWRKTEERVSWQ